MNIQIKKLERCLFDGEASAIVATFDAIAGDFNIRCATLRQNYDDGTFFVGLGGGAKKRTGITLPRHCETRTRLLAAAVDAYDA